MMECPQGEHRAGEARKLLGKLKPCLGYFADLAQQDITPRRYLNLRITGDAVY